MGAGWGVPVAQLALLTLLALPGAGAVTGTGGAGAVMPGPGGGSLTPIAPDSHPQGGDNGGLRGMGGAAGRRVSSHRREG